MTPKQKREAVALLKAAKKYQKEALSMSYGLCASLDAAAYDLRLDPEPMHAMIRKRLYPYSYLHRWLLWCGHVRFGDLETPEGFAKLQRTRLAWIDSLIEELSE